LKRKDAKIAKKKILDAERGEAMEKDAELLRRQEPSAEVNALSHDVIGAAIEVHRVLGPGFLEAVYEEALCIELKSRGIPFSRQITFGVDYKGHRIGESRLDLLVGDCLIVEIKAVESLLLIHKVQARSYLKATGRRLAILINFNVPVLKDDVKRVVCS
jgi:GxxExxY protein